ncbi:MAG: PASTA domain-containing protein [Acidimicrobiales bacterium]
MRAIADLRTGLLLQGRYRLESELGVGSSARVYLADDIRLHRPVAVKFLHPALSNDETFVRRFRLEARAAASLNHPNIVHVYDWGSEDEGFYVVLEYLAGGSLRELLARNGTISIAQATSIGVSIAQALAFAHDRGVVHRDVKPANLLFDETANAHIADFGLAKALSEASWTEPNGLVLGTARYASPEQALGQFLDDRSDVYSLGLVLYEAVTGCSPFAGDSLHAVLIARVGNELPPTPELGPLEPVVAAATQPDRTARISAADFAWRLTGVLSGLDAPEPLVVDARSKARAFDADDVTSSSSRVHEDGTDLEDLTILDARHAASAIETDAPRRPQRNVRRRRLARLISVVVAIVALAAVGTIAIARYVVFSHIVPNLVHDRLAAARHDLSAHGLRLHVASQVFSTAVPIGAITKQTPRPGIRERSGTAVDVVVSRGPATVAVPQLLGDSKASAVNSIKNDHLVAVVSSAYNETVPLGKVANASPSAGTVRYGSKVDLSISLGPRPRTIPQFAATSYADASERLSALKLVPVERLAYSNTVLSGVVISTSPSEGATGVKVGTQVSVLVSRGPRLVAVPSVANLPIDTAVMDLRRAGLVVNEQIGPPFATKATTTNPAPGTEVRPGSPVTLYVA